jgi:putative hydrolase of the HAD superfamily
VVEKYGLTKDQTWMIGNSPMSDINPALRAGLNAVFIPNDMTWVIENGEIHSDGALGTLLVVERFADLLQHF